MRSDVEKWLDAGEDPEKGIALLERAGAKPLSIRMMKANPKANAGKIKTELCRIAGITAPKNSAAATPVKRDPQQPGLRDEFPFLNSPSCPVELQALVTRKFTAYYAFTSLHKKLSDCTDLDMCAETAKGVIDNYKENRAIYAELDYYKKHKTILGKHPIFKHFLRMKEIRSLSVKELVKLQDKLKHNIWRINSNLKKSDEKHLEADRLASLKDKEAELAEVNRLLGE